MVRPSERLQRQIGVSFRKCTGDQTVNVRRVSMVLPAGL